jgi:hypothetical protein
MREFDNFSVRIKNFKCFGNEEQGFDTIKPINIIIGDIVKSGVRDKIRQPSVDRSNQCVSVLDEYHL